MSTEFPAAILVSDGSVTENGDAGCACLLSGPGAGRRYKLNAVLGSLSTSDAELAGCVLGLSLISQLSPVGNIAVRSATWYCDCRSVCERAAILAGKAALGQAEQTGGLLWQIFSAYARDLELQCCWSYGAGVDREINACDRASRWAAEDGLRMLKRWGAGPVGRLRERDPAQAWHLLDLRSWSGFTAGAIPSLAVKELTGCVRGMNLHL